MLRGPQHDIEEKPYQGEFFCILLDIDVETVFFGSNFIGGGGVGAVKLAISFSNVPTAFIFITKNKHTTHYTFSQAPFTTAALVSNAVEFAFDLEQPENIWDLRIKVLILNLFSSSFWRNVTEF
jgi:hypothetical protein